MSVLIIRPESTPGQYRWRRYDRRAGWLAASQTGALQTLCKQHPGAQVWLMLDGPQLVMRRLPYRPEERKHLSRLIPFELESDIAGDIQSLHIAIGAVEPETVTLAYVDREWFAEKIETLESAGLEVSRCFVTGQLIDGDNHDWKILVADGAYDSWLPTQLSGLGLSVDVSMLPLVAERVQREAVAGASPALHVFASSQSEADHTVSMLPESIRGEARTRVSIVNEPWDALTFERPGAIDLRQGLFAAPVRWQKLWRPARIPVIAAAAALLIFLLSSFIELQINNADYRRIQQQVEQVYRTAVPQGVLVDAEQQLRSQLAQLRGSGASVSVLPLLDQIAPVLLQHGDVRVHRLNFLAARQELQLALTAQSNAQLLAFSEALGNAGLSAQARNISQAGSRQQANLLVSGVAP
ncbi:MAG: type II secretion system protein GspL [Pseudomonadota bacterium]|nr:type II secretion system protein GspL [Pseudomonadota bacterium]